MPSRCPLHPVHEAAPTQRVAGSTQGQGVLAPPSNLERGPRLQGICCRLPRGGTGGTGCEGPPPSDPPLPWFWLARLNPLPVSHRSSTGGIQTGTKPGTFCNQEKNKGSQAQRERRKNPNAPKTLLCFMKSAPFSPDEALAPAQPQPGQPLAPPLAPAEGFLLALPGLGRAQRVPEPAWGAASTHRAPQDSGALDGDETSRAGCRGCSVASTVDAGRGRKAAVPVPIPQWGLFWKPWAGCGPAGSAPDSHPHWLGGSRWRVTAPASLPTGLGRGTGAGGDPLPGRDPPPPHPGAAPSETALPEKSPPSAGHAWDAGSGYFRKQVGASRQSWRSRGKSCSRARRLH